MIRRVAGRGVALVDSATATAKYTKWLLEKEGLAGKAGRSCAKFFVSDDTGRFAALARLFLKKNVRARKAVL